MAQEVYVVIFTKGGSCLSDTVDWYVHTELREVFTSLEKAKKYCETPDNYLNDFPKGFSSEFKPFWDARGRTYVVLDDDKIEIFFSIETRVLITDEPETEYVFSEEEIKETSYEIL